MKRETHRAMSAPARAAETARQATSPLDRLALDRLRRAVAAVPIRFVLWDGYAIGPPAAAALATVTIKTRGALFGWLLDPDVRFGEAYASGAIEVRGDLALLLERVFRELPVANARRSWPWPRANDARASRANVHHHYDLGNEFYRRWLDREMVYTCAYFPTPEATLEQAQIAKMDLVCRKLALAPGERVAEAGCGWGALALFMARHYGVHVRAFNLSSEQVAWARRRAREEHLADRVEFVLDDYRNLTGRYDAFVSVGMLEHVGLPDYAAFGRVIDRALDANGRGLLHFIGRDRPAPLNRWIRKRIFPGGYPPTLRQVFEHVLEPRGFSVRDVENLRLHYAKTLEHWLGRFEDAAEETAAAFDETFVRTWRLYLAASRAAFVTGSLQLFQVLFSRTGSNAIPWTRAEA
jgi:cyclopropane-fatty-acyl-phospholipid synthase